MCDAFRIVSRFTELLTDVLLGELLIDVLLVDSDVLLAGSFGSEHFSDASPGVSWFRLLPADVMLKDPRVMELLKVVSPVVPCVSELSIELSLVDSSVCGFVT